MAMYICVAVCWASDVVRERWSSVELRRYRPCVTTELLLAPPEPRITDPAIFAGLLEPGVQAAQALLVLGKVARTAFYVPPGASARRSADPVFSCDGATLRAESFSPCCGVHARLDVPLAGQPEGTHRSGCTNVDLGEATRTVLSGIVGAEPLHLTVRGDGVRFGSLDGTEDEEVVPVPGRWVAGFAEVAAVTSAMTRQAGLDEPSARSFLRQLPTRPGGASWAVRSGSGLRLSARGGQAAIAATGVHRLRVVEPLLRFVRGLTVYGVPGGEVASWELVLDAARFTVTLSPAPARGFSGEGGLLAAQVAGPVDPELFTGRIGHDLAAGVMFERALPSGRRRPERRLEKARGLVAAGAVLRLPDGGYEIRHGMSIQRARLDPLGCTCQWWARHQGSRGPCSHLLAAQMLAG